MPTTTPLRQFAIKIPCFEFVRAGVILLVACLGCAVAGLTPSLPTAAFSRRASTEQSAGSVQRTRQQSRGRRGRTVQGEKNDRHHHAQARRKNRSTVASRQRSAALMRKNTMMAVQFHPSETSNTSTAIVQPKFPRFGGEGREPVEGRTGVPIGKDSENN